MIKLCSWFMVYLKDKKVYINMLLIVIFGWLDYS